jgi:hypothetical protein
MGDDRPEHLRMRANFEAHRQVRLQLLATLEVMGQGGASASDVYCFGGFEALSASLRHVDWPRHFRPATPARFNGSSDPVEFLRQYAVAIRAAGGDGRVMANWFPIATKDEPRRWILGLPPGSVSSWRDLYECFLDKYAPLGPEPDGALAYAALDGLVFGCVKTGLGAQGALHPRSRSGRRDLHSRKE